MPERNRTRRSATQDRHRRLLDLLAGDTLVEIPHLAATLGVSESTVRRDLADLERNGQVVRVLGGALSRPNDPSWHQKDQLNAGAKLRIGIKAATLVPPSSLVFLDAGTTVAKLAGLLAARTDVTLATLSLPSLMALAEGSAEVLVLGGRLHPRGGRLLGSLTSQQLSHLAPDVAFLGADSVDPVRGLNCPDLELQVMKSLIIEVSRASWVLLDSSKLGGRHRHPYFAPLPPSVGLITDAPASPAARDTLEALSSAGHPVIEVPAS
ncbi:DeoR/GlpR family DNA-binding transcription regulator [Propionicicella superfundia]|uniref:DeoR/GlpR family DNA-binding transcription regulator n=1 Tax=Propionicicella superfundia TaxID=348582 RepID=UPI000412666C|nr:DeoR/GlpR family DNA-binding transcription regulator [Propionicicella superfundia]